MDSLLSPETRKIMTSNLTWAVAIFAHNEERNIIRCLNSIRDTAENCPIEIYVLANGCSDRTESLVREYASHHGNVQLVAIPVGDKCNAWNYFVHTVNIIADYFFFMDGDVVAAPNALQELALALDNDSLTDAATALPVSGRSVATQRSNAVRDGGLMGNLYLLRARFINKVRERNVWLPSGIVGDDSLVGALVMWDLNPASAWNQKNIIVCETAGFAFDSMTPTSWHDWRVQWKRMIRYSRRYFEMKMLGELLRQEGLAALPKSNVALYQRKLSQCTLHWRGYWTLFDMLALSQMKRMAATAAAQ